MQRGEVRYYTFHKPDKRRPVVLLTRDSHINALSRVTVAAITTVIRGIDSEVLIGEEDGVREECVINLDWIISVDRARLEDSELITTLTNEVMEQIRSALLYALGFGASKAKSP